MSNIIKQIELNNTTYDIVDANARELIESHQQGQIDDNELITNMNNFVIGEENKVGTKSFEILGYRNIGSEIFYEVSNLDDNGNPVYSASTIPNIINKYITLKIDYNIEHFCYVTGVRGPTGVEYPDIIRIYVNRIFTNDENPIQFDSDQHIDTPYISRTSSNHLIYNTFNLAYAITHKDDSSESTKVTRANRALFIEGMPEVGTFEYRGNSVGFGSTNIVQGDNSYIAGRENISTGRYSSAFGAGNHVGYDDHALGRNNKIYGALDSVAIGFGNVIEDTREKLYSGDPQLTSAMALGYYNHINGVRGIAIGNQLNVPYEGLTAIGKHNAPNANNIFEIGGGTNNNDRMNLFAIQKDGIAIFTQKKETDAVKALLTDKELPISANSFGNFDQTITTLPGVFKNNTQYRGYTQASVTPNSGYYLTSIKLHIIKYSAQKTKVCPMYEDSSAHFTGEHILDNLLGHTPVAGEEFYIVAVRQVTNSMQKIGFGFKNVSPYDSSVEIRIDKMEAYPMKLIDFSIITSDKILHLTETSTNVPEVKSLTDVILSDGKANYAIKYKNQYYLFGNYNIGSTVTAFANGDISIKEGRLSGISTPRYNDDATTKAYVDNTINPISIKANEAFSTAENVAIQLNGIRTTAENALNVANNALAINGSNTMQGDILFDYMHGIDRLSYLCGGLGWFIGGDHTPISGVSSITFGGDDYHDRIIKIDDEGKRQYPNARIRIQDLATPTAGTDAANKDYVDSNSGGIKFKADILSTDMMGFPLSQDPAGNPMTLGDNTVIYINCTDWFYPEIEGVQYIIPKNARFVLTNIGESTCIRTNDFSSWQNTEDIVYIYWSTTDQNWHKKMLQ